MKTFAESNYYKLLDITSNASSLDIHQAYKEMHSLYHDDSLASYSFFSREERREILARIDQAYNTLMDAKSRSIYDQLLIESGEFQEEKPYQGRHEKMNLMMEEKGSADDTALSTRDRLKPMVSSNPTIQEILTREDLCGRDLKKIREALGISLHEIAEIIKVRMYYLKAIENDEYEKTPARIFLKGFLKAYAHCIGLDGDTVATRYLKRMDN